MTQMQVGSDDFTSGVSKLQALATALIWLDACECTSGIPTPPSMPSPPLGAPIPQFQVPVTGGACLHYDYGSGVDVNGNVDCKDSYLITWFDANSNIIGSQNLGTVPRSSTVTANAPIPSGTASAALSVTSTGGCGNYNRGFPALVGIANPTLAVFTLSESYNSGTNKTHRGEILDVYCGANTPQQQVSQCCPVDPSTQAQLNSILQLVTLIQRQNAPFAYVAGTSHTALTGSGEISVQGLLGIKVTPSAIPNWAGITQGDPDTLWLDSWVNWGNLDGWIAREFLRSSPYLSMPQLAGQFTKVGYSLAPGLSVTITELKRES